MAYTTINKSSDYFNTKLYTGNGSTQSITGVGFQPDWTWIKSRTTTGYHNVFDAVRGATKRIFTNDTGAEQTTSNSLTSFDSDGFSLGSNGDVNGNTQNQVSWNWKAGTGQGSSNTDGSINSIATSANATSGFSIVKYTGNGSTNQTIGHGLGTVPDFVIVKQTNTSRNWPTYSRAMGNGVTFLDITDGFASGYTNYFYPAGMTTTTFGISDNGNINESGGTYIAYVFSSRTGYSKFGKLTSNGSDDGTFTYTGFAPKWVMLKPSVTDGWSNWYIFDTTRKENLNDMPLYANLSTQEGYYGGSPATDYAQIDILSNGFKIRRGSGWGAGGSGRELIYMAFGQSLVGTNGVTAKAR